MAAYFRGTGHTLRFIEYMDVGTTNGWRLDDVVPAAEIVERISAEFPLEPVGPSYRGEVAKRWRYKDGGGEIGLISSVTQPFCGDCTRARISAEGRLYTCLFGVRGHDLRALVRGGASEERVARRDHRHLEQAHRPLLRAALGGDGLPDEGGDELHRRLSTRSSRFRPSRTPARGAADARESSRSPLARAPCGPAVDIELLSTRPARWKTSLRPTGCERA